MVPVPGAPDCPEWITGEAKAEWDRQIVDLNARRLLSKSYRAALAMFCQAWGQYVEAVKYIQERGDAGLVTVTDKGNEIQHPMVGIQNKAFERANKLGQQFGFSPSAHAGMKPTETKPESTKKRFFEGKQA